MLSQISLPAHADLIASSSVALMPVRLQDLFTIGIGPSSSHTIGPMKAAASFIENIGKGVADIHRLTATAFGSLAWTGRGHATDKAMILGLAGHRPDNIDPDNAKQHLARILYENSLPLPDGRLIAFEHDRDVVFDTVTHFERHPNAMAFEAFDIENKSLRREIWFSTGGGFVEREGAAANDGAEGFVPHPYADADALLQIGQINGLGIPDIVLCNETAHQSAGELHAAIDRIADVMFDCIERGLQTDGELPGGLKVKRRARDLYARLEAAKRTNDRSPNETMSYVSAFAIAVNEENAAGSRVVTAPTNGAAGVFPAVLRYYRDFCTGASQEGIRRFFLAATAIGGLIKRNASISGAEMGCQGEVGSAAAMAAAGLTAALEGSNAQIENAAEIAIEHHLGMTCDPIGGLVQIPCIERNAFGAIKAINAAHLSLSGDGTHRVSLDQVIETMRQTGVDMSSKYRETSRGGLAVNVPEC
jgi:L-serine dehydratase